MIFIKLYFWIPFIIIAIVYLTKKTSEPKFVFNSVFPNYLHYILIITSIFSISYFYNLDYQIFCQPVLWAKFLILIIFIWLIILPKIIDRYSLNLVMLGLLLFISIYLLAFGSSEYFIFALSNSVIYLPLYFLSLFLNKKFKTQKFGFLNLYGFLILFLPLILIQSIFYLRKSLSKKTLLILIIPFIFLGLAYYGTFKSQIIKELIKNEDYKALVEIRENKTDEYLLELIMGAGWKYHTDICLLDGWRPPFHDPSIVVIRFVESLNHNYDHSKGPYLYKKDNSKYSYNKYKIVFPEKPVRFDCKCASNEILFQ